MSGAHRTYHYWHAFVPGLGPGQIYGYRVARAVRPAARAPVRPRARCCSIPTAARSSCPTATTGAAASRPGDNAAIAMKSVVADPSALRLGRRCAAAAAVRRDRDLRDARRRLHAASELRRRAGQRGTYAGLIEKIPYLQDLGITAVELLPVFQFDQQDAPTGLSNYWGYQPVSFFAPHHGYSSRTDPLGALDEFRDMVKALHRAGIEVILDVVFNHTARGRRRRPDPLLPRARQRGLLHPRGATRRSTPTTPAAATR